MSEQTLVEKIRQLIKLREKKKDLELELKHLNEQISKEERHIVELMLDMDIQSIELDDRKIYLRVNSYPRIIDEQKFFEWLRENGYGSLIKEVVHPQTLRAWYKEYIEEHEDTDLSDMLSIYEEPGVAIRKI